MAIHALFRLLMKPSYYYKENDSKLGVESHICIHAVAV